MPPKQGDFGEGFVEFQIELDRKTSHFDELYANAVIIFDNNEPIETNILEYTIDSVAPVLQVTQLGQGGMIFVQASDSGSGIQLVSIYDGNELIFECNDTEFTLILEPRTTPYEIYSSAKDNVGNLNPIQFYRKILVEPELITSCPNNCSNNGECNEFFACQCFASFTEDDCSRNLTLEEILNEPVDFRFGYKKTNLRNQFIFELELEPSFDQAQVDILGFPSEIQIIAGRDSLTAILLTNETSRLEFEVKVPRDYSSQFFIELVISAQKSADNEENSTLFVIVNSTHRIPIQLESFLPVATVNLLNVENACYSPNEAVGMKFEIEQLEDQDEVNINETIISNTFLRVAAFERIDEQLFEITLESDELEFEPVLIEFAFEIKHNSNDNDQLIIKYEYVLDMCRGDLLTTSEEFTILISNTTWYLTSTEEATTTQKPTGLSTGALIGIIIGSIVFIGLIIGIVVLILKKCKKTDNDEVETRKKNDTEMVNI